VSLNQSYDQKRGEGAELSVEAGLKPQASGVQGGKEVEKRLIEKEKIIQRIKNPNKKKNDSTKHQPSSYRSKAKGTEAKSRYVPNFMAKSNTKGNFPLWIKLPRGGKGDPSSGGKSHISHRVGNWAAVQGEESPNERKENSEI